MDNSEYKFSCSEHTNFSISRRVKIGSNVTFGPKCQNISIGYGTILGRDLYIDVEELTIGEYTTIHHGAVISGKKTTIGHNCWFGHYTIIDSLGGYTNIGNNVGVGAHSQLWSHMQFGDTLQGCRWSSSGRLTLEDDVWLVGHSITGPIHAAEKSMLMTGGVATRDMEANHVYAGSPAKDMTDKFGPQFEDVADEEKVIRFDRLIEEFCNQTGISRGLFEIVNSFDDQSNVTQFNVPQRTYRPIRTEVEYRFIRFMLYERAKWLPA